MSNQRKEPRDEDERKIVAGAVAGLAAGGAGAAVAATKFGDPKAESKAII